MTIRHTPVWHTLPVAQLAPQAAETPAPDDLVAQVREGGVETPLYVTPAADGSVHVIEGLQALAAAVAAGLEAVPVTYRPLVAVGSLVGHPANARRSLAVGRELQASVAAEGVRVPLIVTPEWRVIDGHRRLAAAAAAGVRLVPYAIDDRDEAGQVVDMITTARHRAALTAGEELGALFRAADLGADTRRLAAAAGITQRETKARVRVGRSRTATNAAHATHTSPYALTLDHLTQLAELEELDAEAATEVTAQIEAAPDEDHRWTIRRAHEDAMARIDAKKHRADLDQRGARVRDLHELANHADRAAHMPGDHDGCQGEVWVLESPSAHEYTPYCSNPDLFHPQVKEQQPGTASAAASEGESAEARRAARRAVIEGNRDWDAAQAIRHEWLADLIGRKSHPKAVADQFHALMARELYGKHSGVLYSKGGGAWQQAAEWLGVEAADRDALIERAQTPRRVAVHLFAVLAAAYEEAVPRSAWRVESYEYREARPRVRRWLTWLSELGYEPTPIEAAVIADEPYQPAPQTSAPLA
ncbi:ParB/RepB/Spo0J family partition protein [Streptomyces diastaticus]|uniref:ParB/RepB/Spo0J family partition protein n=1 Tax=Streptomyces diastaticus TaxID=1956 RepID=UPI003D17D48E